MDESDVVEHGVLGVAATRGIPDRRHVSAAGRAGPRRATAPAAKGGKGLPDNDPTAGIRHRIGTAQMIA
jgi:hypothetical protein